MAAQAMQVMLQAQSELASERDMSDSTDPNAGPDGQDGTQSRSGQQARDICQSVSDMAADAQNSRPVFAL